MSWVVLLVLFTSDGGSAKGIVESLKFDMASLEHCEDVAKNLKTIFEVDPVLKNTSVTVRCLEIL